MSDNETGWVKDNGSYYYYYSNGEMAIGWQNLDGDGYYFYDDGSMAWDTMVNGYYVNADGQWTKDEGSREIIDGNGDHFYYYIGPNGKAVTGWNRIGKSFHYYNYPYGSMKRNDTIDGFDIDNYGDIASGTGWLKDEYSGNWCYFSDGQMKTGWIQDGDKWYYLKDDGKMATGWKNIDSDWYYFHSDGTMATGWVEDDAGWYFLYNNGSMAHDYTDGGYHVDKSGKMVTGTGWVYSDGSWYYLKDDGEVATDWLYNQGNWYYLYSQGSMAHNTKVNGLYVDDSGRWITDDDNGNTEENKDIWLPPTLYNYEVDSQKYSIGSQNILLDLSNKWFNANTEDEKKQIERQLLYFRNNIPSDSSIEQKFEEGMNNVFAGAVGQLALYPTGASEAELSDNINNLNQSEGNYICDALTGNNDIVMAGGVKKLDFETSKKIASKIIDNAKAGKVKYSSEYHGRLESGMETDILSNPEAVYISTGKQQKLIFRKGGNVIIVETGGSSKGNLITSYGSDGARGKSGASIFGGSPDDLGMPITDEAIIEGKVPTPKGGTLAPGIRIIP